MNIFLICQIMSSWDDFYQKLNDGLISATGQTGKVVSTCHWGNLLVWEEGHIQLEVTRKDGSTCHEGQINHITAIEGLIYEM